MKTVDIKNFTDKYFEMYLSLLIEIRKKFQDGSLIADNDWSEYQIDYIKNNLSPEKFKKDKLNKIETGKKYSLKEFIFFENEKPVAWIALKRISGERFEFICDAIYEKFPQKLFKAISETVNNYLTDTGIDKIDFWTHDERKKESFKNAGIEVIRETINSKLFKKDIDFAMLKDIVDKNIHAQNYELRLMNEFPEELYDDFTEIINEINQESVFLSPQKRELKIFTRESLINLIKADKEDGDPMYMYVLFDKNKIAAFCRVYIEKDWRNYFIQHCGGLTGVGKNYRGKGFAKYLKAKMYLKIYEDYPDFEYALTDTYPWNKYMYKINEELGFKPFEKGLTFGYTKESLKKFL